MHHVIVPDTKNAVAGLFEPGVSTGVGSAVRMLAAINLDDESGRLTDKIGDEIPDRLLAAKFPAINASAAKSGPEPLFHICRFAPHALCPLQRKGFISGHALTLPPLRGGPLPLP